jgi:hypothetical protein
MKKKGDGEMKIVGCFIFLFKVCVEIFRILIDLIGFIFDCIAIGIGVLEHCYKERKKGEVR